MCRSWSELCQSSSEVELKFERSCVEVGATWVEVRAKLCQSSSEVGAKLCRSWSEVVSKIERSYFAKFALKWKHNFRAYRKFGLYLALQQPCLVLMICGDMFSACALPSTLPLIVICTVSPAVGLDICLESSL